ncbi:MAG: hypothetical protein KGL35_17265 [Bradyrhizobium sp.]|nr:hypothetical protein [Bradyrhizobium sp.]
MTKDAWDDAFYNLYLDILALQTTAAPVGIVSITEPAANTIQFNLTNSTSVSATITVPTPQFSDWTPLTAYAANAVVYAANGFYVVLQAHTSAASFDPGATDGAGHALYGLLIQLPAVVRKAVSDADYSVQPSDNLIGYVALTAARTLTLPAASAYPTGYVLAIADESGACSALNTITIAAAGTDKIDGAATAALGAPYAALSLESDGVGKWTLLSSFVAPAASAPLMDGTAAAGVSTAYARADHVHPSDASRAALAGAIFTGPLTAAAGTASAAPLTLQAGVELTTPAAGAIEYDGAALYATVAAGARGVVAAEQFARLAANYTLASQTAAQPLFNTSAAGALTLAAGLYRFECEFALTGLSATAGSFGFALGGSAAFSQSWQAAAAQPPTLATPTLAELTFNSAANASLTPASTNQTGLARITGTLNVTAAGTLIPQVSLTQAAAAVAQAGAYFKISPLGAAGATLVGPWS